MMFQFTIIGKTINSYCTSDLYLEVTWGSGAIAAVHTHRPIRMAEHHIWSESEGK
jgi:hypothetical protein